MKKYDLNIKNILQDWTISDAIREIISNAIDENVITKSNNILISKNKLQKWIIRDFGRGIKAENFSQNESKEKNVANNLIGKFGVGLKDAISVLFRNDIKFSIQTKEFVSYPIIAKKDGFDDIETIHMVLDNKFDPKWRGTEFVFENLNDQDVEKAKSNFLIFNDFKTLNTNKFGEIIKTKSSYIYVNGMKIAEDEGYIFSYNITKKDKKLSEKMNRERKSLGREGYSHLIEKILDEKNINNEIAELFFKNQDCGEMSKKNIRKRVYKKINNNEKYVFMTQDKFDSLESGELEVFKRLNKEIRIVKDSDSDFLDFLYDSSDAIGDYNKNFSFEIVDKEKINATQKANYVKSMEIIAKLNNFISVEVVKSNNPISSDALGYWSSTSPNKIFIVLNALNDLQTTIITTIHEYAHSINGNYDNTRDFEKDLETAWYEYSIIADK